MLSFKSATKVWTCFQGNICTCIYSIYNSIIIFPLLNHTKIFKSIPDEPPSISSSTAGQITCTVINTSNEITCLLQQEFWIYKFSQRILERVFVESIVNIRNETVSFFLRSWGMNWRRKQTNHWELRFTWFVCPTFWFTLREPPKKDTHSLNNSRLSYLS